MPGWLRLRLSDAALIVHNVNTCQQPGWLSQYRQTSFINLSITRRRWGGDRDRPIGFSAGVGRLPNSALRAPPKIVIFLSPRLKLMHFPAPLKGKQTRRIPALALAKGAGECLRSTT